MYNPFGYRSVIGDLFRFRDVYDLHEDHKTNPVIRLDVVPNTLVITCLHVLAKTFSSDAQLAPDILKSIPHFNQDLFHHIIPIDAPLTITIPNIKNEAYWRRCCKVRWTSQIFTLKEKNFKQFFCETYLADFLEKVDPGYEDYNEIRDLCILLHKHITKLRIKSLRAGKKSKISPIDCNEVEEIPKRLDLRYITAFLPKLVEIQITFGMDNPINVSAIRQAVLLEAEIDNIGEAIAFSKLLTVLKITTSYFKANDFGILYHYIIESKIMVIAIESCFLGNTGAQIAALLIKNHKILIKLSLKDNEISTDGAFALAYALTHKPGSQLTVLDLSMNPIGDEAGCCFATAIMSHPFLEELDLTGTRLSNGAGALFAKAIKINKVILNLNLSCNVFDRNNAMAILDALEENNNIEFLDVRGCGFAHETLYDIREMLFENREGKRIKIISKSPKRRKRVLHLKESLDVMEEEERNEPIIYDPVPHYGSHRTSSLTLSDHGQLTLSTLDSTSSASTVEKKECAELEA